MALPEAFQILQTNWAEECDLGHRAKCWRRAGGTGCPEGLVAKLIAQHGADMRLPDLREILVGDCPRLRAASFNDRCAVHYPQLVELSNF